jgi:hypothetical protein
MHALQMMLLPAALQSCGGSTLQKAVQSVCMDSRLTTCGSQLLGLSPGDSRA